MTFTERWIWLPLDKYPNNQTTAFSCGGDPVKYNYTVAEFKKTYTFDKKVKRADFRFSADTAFHLYCNDLLVATGPVVVGGDFLESHRSRDLWYATSIEIYPDSNVLDLFARVKMMPVELCEYSKGKGGFMLTGHIEFEDGTKKVIFTDNTWLCRKNNAYVSPKVYNACNKPDEYVNARIQDNVWFCKDSPIPLRSEEEIVPERNVISLCAGEENKVTLDFDKIYSCFVKAVCKAKGIVKLKVHCSETGEEGSFEDLTFDGNGEYRSFELHSAGRFDVTLKNESNDDAVISLSLIFPHYPVDKEAKTATSDHELNKVLDVCRHTLKVCRQTHHLDSPRHSEPLACTGDYYIETLMTLFSFGDMRLSELDIMRTAELIIKNDGKMYHTTYSLIWVQMLYDVYMFTGNKKLLEECLEALIILLSRFEAYVTELGIIDNPPNYMFVDWIFIDGFSMHHPPKALGQSCLNMFYYGALDYAEKIYEILGEDAMAKNSRERKISLRENINKLLFDAEKGIYFEGLNHRIPDEQVIEWEQPQNTDKRYYLPHSNILACCYGVADGDTARSILSKVMRDEWPCSYQPYFAHFMFEAIYKAGLRDEFTLELLERWKAPIKECDKGLVEGFISPNENYTFDHSHAWGGTPLYSLPKALCGFEVIEPEMKKIRLSPSLIGLESARVEIPTPFGDIIVEQQKGRDAKITYPDEITII